MNEIDAYEMEENAGISAFLVDTIAEELGISLDKSMADKESLIAKDIYKDTRCGAWIEFDSEGIMVGTIVEGSNAKYSERLKMTENPKTLLKSMWAALERCEDFSDEHFGNDEC